MVTLLLFVSCKAEVKSAKIPTEILIAIQLQKLANKGKSTIEFQDSLTYTNTVCPDMNDTTLITKAEADSVFNMIAQSYFLTSIRKDSANIMFFYFRPQSEKQFTNQNLLSFSNRRSNNEETIEFEYEYQSGYTFVLILQKDKLAGISKFEPC